MNFVGHLIKTIHYILLQCYKSIMLTVNLPAK